MAAATAAAMLMRVVLRGLLAVCLAWLAGCAALPEQPPAIPMRALPVAPDTALARIAAASTADPEQSGFRLLPTGQFALQARLELAQRAQRSLDVQYYQIHDDRTPPIRFATLASPARPGGRCARRRE